MLHKQKTLSQQPASHTHCIESEERDGTHRVVALNQR